MSKQTVVFDFDGVIHSYKSGWKGADCIPDPPVPGIKEAIDEIRLEYEVVVVSSRCHQVGGTEAIIRYLYENNIFVDRVSADKVPAIVYIDDRGVPFCGRPDKLLSIIKKFKPWNKGGLGFIPTEDIITNIETILNIKEMPDVIDNLAIYLSQLKEGYL